MDSKTLQRLNSFDCQQLLTNNILPFWIDYMVDHSHGGFYGRIDGNNLLDQNAPKAIILNTRILWTFSASYRQFGNEEYKSTAIRAFEYLKNYFVDLKYGGVFWMLNSDGTVMESKKQVYAQAFAIYALSEFYLATGSQESLEMTKSIYLVVEKHSFDHLRNGYLEAFDQKWNLLDDLRLSDKDANEAKTMNTHLHVLEAYSKLYQVWPNKNLASQLENLVHLFLDKFINEKHHFQLFFDENWNLKSHVYSYGHDIEGGWLLQRAAEVLQNPALVESCKVAAIGLTEAALEGFDHDGGLMYEGTESTVEDTDKHWWPQAEALVGLVNAFNISGNPKYLKLAEKNWNFIIERMVDPKGEWHGMVYKDGSINLEEDKAGPWKAPYHNGRAMLELMERLE